jgi:HEAT repeat protein
MVVEDQCHEDQHLSRGAEDAARINVAKTNKNPVVRKEALFWLGQTGDPRALDYIESILKQ